MSLEAERLINHVYQMDCLELMKQMPDETVSMILTDPPYGISYQNQFTNQRHLVLEGDSGIPYERFASESYRILRGNSHAYFFTRYDCYPYHYECLKQAGFSVKNCMVIEKGTIGGIGDLKGSFANNAEWIIFCQKGRGFLTELRFLKIRKKKVLNSIEGVNLVKNTRRGLTLAGLEKNIPNLPIIPCGRRRTRYTILR